MRWTLVLTVALLAGCGADGHLGERAAACWGLPGDCVGALAGARVGLGVMGPDRAALEAPCDALVACGEEATGGEATDTQAPGPGGAHSPPAKGTDASGETALPSRLDSPSTPTGATPTPARAESAVATLGGSKSCADLSPSELDGAASLSPADLVCLSDIARGTTNAADPDRQTAAIALYNRKASGWGAAVEAALERPALQNAPALNFAGIKAAYDSGKYLAVVRRADSVWTNLDKGFQLSAGDKGFLVEFACRASGQLALSGKAPDHGLAWCERWMARATKAGQDTAPIQDLLDQLQ